MKQPNTPRRASAVIAAAGNSSRMGKDTNKQLLFLSGMPILAHTLRAFDAAPEISEIIIVTRSEDLLTIKDLVKEFSIGKVKAIIPGGISRQESVYLGLCHVQEERVLIHDGARPLISAAEIKGVIEALDSCRAAALGVPVKDTIKQVTNTEMVASTLPRELLRQIQTPQGFYTEDILSAHQKATADGITVTDDCSLAEYIGIPVKIVPGSYQNLKVTTPEDLILAEALLNAPNA